MASQPSKKRRLTPSESEGSSVDGANAVKVQKAFFKSAANWTLENDYESRRKKKKLKDPIKLPIKTADGRIEHIDDAYDASVASDAEWLQDADGHDVDQSQDVPKVVETPRLSEREQILVAKEELAKAASLLNEDPDENPGAFKALAKVGDSPLPSIQKLSLVTQLAVYKDVIPGYRIRSVFEDAPGDKLSKEVRRTRTYETALVTGYQGYVRKLAHVAAAQSAGPTGRGQSLADVAVTCACTLLNTVPHFNFRGDLLKILVRKLSRRTVDRSFVQCRSALQTLFREDEEGRPSMEAVSLLTKMMKTRQFKIDESVVNLFLHLRLLSEFLGRASGDSVTRENEDVAPRKKDREFRTKREKKRVKEDRAVAKVMEQADALVSHEERDHMQSETLKLVFATYFRILKLRTPHLMGAVLEGLQKYSHLINQDYFGDLLEALKDLIRGSQQPGGQLGDERNKGTEEDHLEVIRDTNREILLCTATAFALLAGQDAHNARGNLHLDLSFFTQNLYQSLLPLSISPDVEVGARSLPRRDSGDSSPDSKMDIKVNLETTTALLMRCLLGVLLPQWNSRSVPPLRIAAFTKQLMTASLHVPEKSSQAIVGLLQDVAHSHGKKITALWNTEERRGDGSWNPLSQTVEASNVYSSTVFEGELLKRHYCPKVREGVRQLEKSLSSI